MRIYVWLAPLVLSSTILVPGCNDSSNAPNTDMTEQRPAETKMSDSDLEKSIKAKLDSDSDVRQARLSVNADADEKKVTLKGQVASQDLRAKAVELVKSAQPRVTINDEIEVKPAG